MWQWVKACKGVALIAFFLPWMTVSCSGAELIRASGWDLATGHPRLAPALAQMAQGSGAAAAQRGEAHASVWLILALLAIVAGLVAAFRPSGVGAKPLIGAALAAIVLILVGTRQIGNAALDKAMAHRGGGGGGFDAMAAAAIRIEWQFAYWLTLAALAAAAVLAWMALTGRSFATRQAPPPA